MKQIGEGRAAELFQIEPTLVLKLYQPRFSRRWVDRAAQIANAVASAGVRAPVIYDVVTLGEQHGIIMEFIPGGTMFDAMLARPDQLGEIADALADLHVGIHGCTGLDLLNQHDRLVEQIERATQLSDPQRMAALQALDDLQVENTLHHGDLHPANVMVTPDGEAFAIDWDGSTVGAAASDVARCSYLLSTWALAPGPWDHSLLEPMRQPLADAYLESYLHKAAAAGRSVPLANIEAWRLPISAARLVEPIPDEIRPGLAEIDRLVAAGRV